MKELVAGPGGLLPDVETVRIKYEQSLSSRDLAQQLGVDHTVISQLIQEGHLRRKPRRTVDGYHALKFDADTARGLLRSHLLVEAEVEVIESLEALTCEMTSKKSNKRP